MRLHRMEGYEELKCTSYTETMRVMLCYSESTFVVGVILRVLTYTDVTFAALKKLGQLRSKFDFEIE